MASTKCREEITFGQYAPRVAISNPIDHRVWKLLCKFCVLMVLYAVFGFN